MDATKALKAHMAKGIKSAHPDAAVKGMRAGGKTNSDMLKMGRNLAKVANQKSPGRKGG
jgi:hypothetical protein